MTTQHYRDIVIPSEHCRACKGRGGDRERVEVGTRMVERFEPCWLCRGSGRQTVRIDPPMGAPRNHGEEIANARAEVLK